MVKMAKTKSAVVVTLLVSGMLASCSDVRWLSGGGMPDETQVVDGPSLILPPSYDLRPPRDGSDTETMLKNQQVPTRELITGASAQQGESTSVDTWLVNNAQGQVDTSVKAEASDAEASDMTAPAAGDVDTPTTVSN